MAFRFRRSVRIFPGVRINLTRRGASLSAGVKGAHMTVSDRGTRTTIGVPGSGAFYTDYTPHGERAPLGKGQSKGGGSMGPLITAVVIAVITFAVIWSIR
jgi:hypothetical protein